MTSDERDTLQQLQLSIHDARVLAAPGTLVQLYMIHWADTLAALLASNEPQDVSRRSPPATNTCRSR